MSAETRIALKNYDWLIRNRSEIELAWDSDVLIDANGGVDINSLLDPGFTPGAADER
jgi:hypothetical protein